MISETCSTSSLPYSTRKPSVPERASRNHQSHHGYALTESELLGFCFSVASVLLFSLVFFPFTSGYNYFSLHLNEKEDLTCVVRSCTQQLWLGNQGAAEFTDKFHWWLQPHSQLQTEESWASMKMRKPLSTGSRITGAKQSNPIFWSPWGITRPTTRM